MRALVQRARAFAMAVALATAAAACSTGGPASTGAAPSVSAVPSVSAAPVPTAPATLAPATPSPTMTFPAGIADQPGFLQVEAGRWWIDANVDPAKELIVEYTLPSGWSGWIGAFLDGPIEGQGGIVSLSIVQVTNLVQEGCHLQGPQDPPVGPAVDDLATALTKLQPFKVVVEPRAAELGGYAGKYVEWEVPDLGGAVDDPFGMCNNSALKSWIGPPLSYAFYGYNTPGAREGFWVLDVDGERLVIETLRAPNPPAEAEAQLLAILESIVIKP